VRLTAFIEYVAVIIGVLAMIAGQFFALPKGFHLGIFMTGAGIALGGIEAIVTRRMCFRPSEDAYEAYAGAPATIVGMMALLIGMGGIATAYLLAEGLWHTTVNYLTRRPAPALVAAGLLLIGIGAMMMLNPRGARAWLGGSWSTSHGRWRALSCSWAGSWALGWACGNGSSRWHSIASSDGCRRSSIGRSARRNSLTQQYQGAARSELLAPF